ncbi:LamG domain-containing protein [Sediminitomix flava]|uniref:Concanavalin A-like lectin/glucanase superfamily protein n=1 Tax=Sediminitomix flava TaxID=379075 RepID=A0A315ZFM5_SEDFL|nr:LamG domain-containing protein [Sediminitomix flava]PWJ44375.1 concanavalin A-like lectin/glucanase superfamily protein [Sediminitomix flava]
MKHFFYFFLISLVSCEGEIGLTEGNSLFNIVNEPIGENCSAGGQKIDIGIDLNKNGTLDYEEIESTQYICNGENGTDGQSSLIKLTEEKAGNNCFYGGYKIETGIDLNKNDILDEEEVEYTQYICHTDSYVSLKSNLVAYYPFIGNGDDITDNGNNSTVYNASLTNDRKSNTNSAYHFDGNSYISIPHSSSFAFDTQFSIAVWVKPSAFNSDNCESNRIIEKGIETQRGNWGLYYDDNFEGNGCGELDPNKVRFKFGIVGDNGYRYAYVGETNINLNEWYFVTGTYDGSQMKLYVNGEVEFSENVSINLYTNTAPITIGKQDHSSYPYFLNGAIDDIHIFNKALTKEEVDLLYNL